MEIPAWDSENDPSEYSSDREKRLGTYFKFFRISQRAAKLIGRTGIAVLCTEATVNFFVTPEDRLTYTAVPLMSCVGLEVLVRLHDSLQDNTQNKIIELGTKDFPNSLEQ